ncbi:ABC-F family ATP-binding cassette domain-containing protein [Thermanaerothrix sp. 4228-RoL]|uniref:ABC-F family ATP-binding cassette domain-containing protein n=1 Tax=Thermanaerothrix solaris TaxID=3058434 RepID=A0ABU3NPW6_9CHLR|nr:ABC-F family ATP-binding cassette domain-containing protein [Thermanaerothrix sp. 4228-RoL]MDT8898420.1 ABC-F family ATP-binding cassette domain-containing protein [Thermanaerothrix sp. 4228-RoL]
MSLITATDLAKSFGAQDVFIAVTLSIPRDGRIGLVGANGVGKTTLLRILAGLEEPTRGEVQRAKGLRLGYLPQEVPVPDPSLNVWAFCRQAFAHLIAMEEELARLAAAMGDPAQGEAALIAYSRLQTAYEHQGGYTYEHHLRQTLIGLGFTEPEWQRPLGQLSGGQRTRAYLARLLLETPDLLLLDEPTNHLDIQALEWLEKTLRDWPGAVVVVSHDRYFLDHVVSTVWELTPEGLEVYRGNYSAYWQQRRERYQRRLEEYEAQLARIEKEDAYIRRNLAGQNARQALGRRKRLERLLEQVRRPPPPEPRRIRLNFGEVARSGDLVLRTQGLAIGYRDEGRPLFHVPDLLLKRGECAAILGPNGAGKTTFLKTLLGEVPPYAGEVILGAGLNIGYFAQAHEGLDPHKTPLATILDACPTWLPAQARDYLARFLFSGDDVFKPIAALSGGERGRLALACLALAGANFLLLDEPTNHLDVFAQEVLQTVLAAYEGTILLVSHDRYLIDTLATQIWHVQPEERRLQVFAGTYSAYREAQEAAAAAAKAAPAAASSRPHRENASTKAQRRTRQALEALEAEIAALEADLARVTRRLEHPPSDPLKVAELGREYERLQRQLEERWQRWAELAEEGDGGAFNASA